MLRVSPFMAISGCAGVTVGLLAREGEVEVSEWELVDRPLAALKRVWGPCSCMQRAQRMGFTALQLACNGSGAGSCL